MVSNMFLKFILWCKAVMGNDLYLLVDVQHFVNINLKNHGLSREEYFPNIS